MQPEARYKVKGIWQAFFKLFSLELLGKDFAELTCPNDWLLVVFSFDDYVDLTWMSFM